MAQKKFLDLTGLTHFWGKVKDYVDTLGGTKVDKVPGKQLSTNDYTTEEKNKLAGLNNYTLPVATKTSLGGVKVGAGLTIDGGGNLSATGGGEADSVNWDNVVGKPEALSEFENDLDFQTASDVASAVAGKADKTYVDGQLEGKADVEHTHTKADITDFPTSMKNPTAIKVQLNGGAVEGTSQFTYDGSTAKNINITAAGIGAAAATHTHTKSQITDMPTKLSQFTNDSGFQTAANVDTKLEDYAKKTDITAVYKYKGSVENYAALPSSGQQVGDTYNVKAADSSHNIKAGDNVSWDGTAWDVLSGVVDLTGYVQESDLVAISTNEIDGIVA